MRRTLGVVRRVVWGLAMGLGLVISGASAYGQGTLKASNPNYWAQQRNEDTALEWMMLNGSIGASSKGGEVSAPGGTVPVNALMIPEPAMKELRLSQKRLDAGNLAETIKHLEKAISIYPRYAGAHQNLGLCFARLKEYDKAIPEFQNAAELDTNLVKPWISLTGAYFLQGRYVEAESAARRALEIEPANTLGRYLLGKTLAQEGNGKQEAVDLLLKSTAEYPGARLELARIYLRNNELAPAVAELRGYLAQPNAPEKEKVSCMVEKLTKPEGTVSCSMR